jgi:uncharacterized protein YgiM (DUF1202 family)
MKLRRAKEDNDMKRSILITVFLLLLTLGWTAAPAAAQAEVWVATYFANNSLSGSPSLIQTEYNPNIGYNWGTGSPHPAIPVDNFSARWTMTRSLSGGFYQISASADDGVRVYVDGVLYINEWHAASGLTYTSSVNLFAGQHNIVVEYYEQGGLAFINFSLAQSGGGNPPPSGNTATVTTPRLNVRNAPNPYTGAVIMQIYQGQVYTIVGRNANTSWLQININGTVGWVNAAYVYAPNAGAAPVTDSSTNPPPPPPQTGTAQATIIAGDFLNLRTIPSAEIGTIIMRLYYGQVYPIIGRNNDNSWLQLNVNGVRGWVNARFVSVNTLANVPVTINSVLPTSGTGTVNTGRLNVRAAPGIWGWVVTRVSYGDTYPLVGRNVNASWVQINVSGTVGWVNRGYLVIPGGFNVFNLPVTG